MIKIITLTIGELMNISKKNKLKINSNTSKQGDNYAN